MLCKGLRSRLCAPLHALPVGRLDAPKPAISYHPQSGGYDEGPQRGPKNKVKTRNSNYRIQFKLRVNGADPGRLQKLKATEKTARRNGRAFSSHTARGGGLPVVSYQAWLQVYIITI